MAAQIQLQKFTRNRTIVVEKGNFLLCYTFYHRSIYIQSPLATSITCNAPYYSPTFISPFLKGQIVMGTRNKTPQSQWNRRL